jgi:hypothetical protein
MRYAQLPWRVSQHRGEAAGLEVDRALKAVEAQGTRMLSAWCVGAVLPASGAHEADSRPHRAEVSRPQRHLRSMPTWRTAEHDRLVVSSVFELLQRIVSAQLCDLACERGARGSGGSRMVASGGPADEIRSARRTRSGRHRRLRACRLLLLHLIITPPSLALSLARPRTLRHGSLRDGSRARGASLSACRR